MQNLIDIADILRERRRSVKITIDTHGKLVVFAPIKMNTQRLGEIINQKAKWIEKKMQQIAQVNIDHQTIINFKQISVCGTLYDITAGDTKTITIEKNQVIVPNKYYIEGSYIKHLLKWQRALGAEILTKRLETLGKTHGIGYKSLKIGDFKAKWGSCDTNKNIKLNWRLVMLPHNVIDYVILHELSHTYEMNHSQKFYAVLERLMPGWKQARLTLKRNNFLLGIYR
ncbi:MAG: M48 family metallopeptidase [Christensenellaceae bacterium]|jgi:predicted metal-dependent hydrolase|nr:M48 family metallopeptidase [Christensenellaceae bacterium]